MNKMEEMHRDLLDGFEELKGVIKDGIRTLIHHETLSFYDHVKHLLFFWLPFNESTLAESY